MVTKYSFSRSRGMRLSKGRHKYLYVSFLAFLCIIVYKSIQNSNVATVFVILRNEQHISKDSYDPKLKYILQWTSPITVPFNYMGEGQTTFIERKCPYTNCYVTSNRNYLNNITRFDVIAFAGPELEDMRPFLLPNRRSPHQKYVFASIESSVYYPVCHYIFDGYFNWTWTFKLDSDSRWGYIIVRDIKNNIIGPKKEMHWIKHANMTPVSEKFKQRLRSKKKLAAWFVSHCSTHGGREAYIKEMQNALSHLGLTIDVYGKCGILECSRDDEEKCNEMLRNNYYFYMAFENAISEDYVTEKVLHGLNYDTVPVVFGGANYSRFLPPGSYVDASATPPNVVADKLAKLFHDFDNYAEYFRWKSYYTFHKRSESVLTDDYCSMCALLNDEEKVKKTTVYENFRIWWEPDYKDYCAPEIDI